LWGAGEILPGGEAAVIERGVADRFSDWAIGLARRGLRQERRPLRVVAAELDSSLSGEVLELAFELPAGAYATVLLRELLDWSEQRT
jgi:tRNA pseudouridine13 synthase